MANRYWVGGSGTWNTTSTTNWSASSGGPNGASVPTAADAVFFDQAATYTVTLSGTLVCLDITVSAGTVTISGTGSLGISGSMSLIAATVWSATTTVTFNATSAKTITTNGVSISGNVVFNGVAGTWQLQDNFTLGGVRNLTHTNGTINLNGKTLTIGGVYQTAAGTKNLTFNGGTLLLTGSGTPFYNFQNTGYTTTAGTGIGKISLTSASAKTFTGSSSGSVTYNCTLSNDGAGALTMTSSCTFTTITNTVQPTSFLFTAGTTTTVTNWNVSGTAGNLVTIGSVTAATHTLSKSSGTVSSNYLSISYSKATGGATWNAGANSVNGGNNTGWIFSAPSGAGGKFLVFF